MCCKRKQKTENQGASLYQTRSRSRTMLTPHFSVDLISNILSRLPAELVEDLLKYVCKAWTAIPNDSHFISMHLQRSKPCLYVQEQGAHNRITQFVAINGLKSEVLYKRSPLPGPICDSNAGMLLIYQKLVPGTFYAANPITRKIQKLSFETQSHFSYAYILAKLVRINDGKFKVMFFGRDETDGSLHWYVLTLDGNMSWREISCDGVISGQFFPERTISVGGVAFWNNRYNHRHTLAVDLNDESSHLLVSPEELVNDIIDRDRGHWQFMKVGNDLCASSRSRSGDINMWTLKDLRQNIWEKKIIVINFAIRGFVMKFGTISQVTLMDDQQLLVLRIDYAGETRIVAVDLNTRRVKTLRKYPRHSIAIGVHINSFVAI